MRCSAGWMRSRRRPRRCRAGRRCISRNGTSRRSPASAGWPNWCASPAATTSSPSAPLEPLAKARILEDARRGGAARAGHHPGLVVRQEVPPRPGGRAPRLGRHSGGARRRTARDQVADHPAAGPGRTDRRRGARSPPSCRRGARARGAKKGQGEFPAGNVRTFQIDRTGSSTLTPFPISADTAPRWCPFPRGRRCGGR